MSARTTGAPPPLKMEDLMERWGVSAETIREHIKTNALPYWDAGTGRGKRPDYRFRIADIEAWEAARVQVREEKEGDTPPLKAPVAFAAPTTFWDGKIRGNRGTTRRKS